MERFKKNVMQEIIKLREKHSLRKSVGQKVIVGILVTALLVEQIGTLTVYASAAETTEEETKMVISAFSTLPEEIREQRVPVGTALEELILPETLEATVLIESNNAEETEDSEETENSEGTKDSEETEKAEDTKNPEEVENPEETADPEGTEKPEDTKNPEETENPEGTENPGGTENPEETENSEGTENPGGTENPEETENSGETENREENPSEQETGDKKTEDQESDTDIGDTAKMQTETFTVSLEKVCSSSEEMIVETLVRNNADSASEDETEETGEESTKEETTEEEINKEETIEEEVNKEETTKEEVSKEESTEETKKEETGESITENITIENITWTSSPEYDGETVGEYIFTPELPGGGYILLEDVSLPQITVTVEEEQTAAPQISQWYFDEKSVVPKGDLFYEDGRYSFYLPGGDSEIQIPVGDIIPYFPEKVMVELNDAGMNGSADEADMAGDADQAGSADKIGDKESTNNANNAGYVNNTGDGDNTSHVDNGEGIDNTKGDTLNEEVLSILDWECPEYAEDEEGNLPYSGRFFFKARLGMDGEEKEYAYAEDVEQVGIWLVFDEPMTTAAMTVTPGRITSDQEWGEQTLAAGTYTIDPGVTVTVSGRLTVSGSVTINGGGKLVRASGYTGSSSNNGSYSTLLYVYGGNLTLENINIDGNKIDAYGPAVFIKNGTVNMRDNAVIQNNYNRNSPSGIKAGGGVYCEGTLNIMGGTIRDCRTKEEVTSNVYSHAGGGVYIKSGTCKMTSGSITGNFASHGGGIYLGSENVKLIVEGGTIDGNEVYSNGKGMGIYYSTLNDATSILSIGGEANIKDNIYLDNTRGTLCPEITSALRYKITLKCSSRDEGKVLAKGSGYTLTGVDASKVTMADSDLFSKLDKANNQIILSSTEEAEAEWQESSGGAWKTGKFTTALANVYSGGTIRLLTDIVFNEKVLVDKTVTITSKDSSKPCTITRMPTGEFGNITLTGSGNLTLTNIIYDGNRGYISGEGVKQSLIKVGNNASDTGVSLTLGSGCTIRDGYKIEGSGVIAVYGNMTMNSGAVIENCEVTGTGGAVWIHSNGTFTMNGGTIRGCKAGGGGSAVSVDGTCNLKGGTITGNTDTSDKNCAVYLRGSGSGHLTLNGISISGNTYSVYNDGKNVSVTGNSTLSGSIYTTNAITASGTAVSGLTSTYTIKMSSVTNGTTVVTGSKDTQHYKLDNAGYGLIPGSGTSLIAGAAYTITYNKNSGTIANESNYTSYTYGAGLTLPTPTRTNYTFGGWYTSSNFSGTAVTSISTTATGNKTYYAKWTANTYTITYNKNSGTIANESNYTSYTYGAGLTLPTSTATTRTGYTFDGWYTTSNFSGSKVTSISATDTGNKTYYAKWKANTYTITYNKNDGTIANESNYTSYTYGTGLTLPTSTATTKTGYTFDGWYTTSSFSGNKVTSISATDYGNKTYYAKWTAKTYQVTFDYQGATGGNSTANKNVTYNSTYGTLPTPTRTGYTFKGWFTQAGGNGSQVEDTTTVKITSAQTLYAYWKDETKPNTPILKSGVTLPTDWTKTQKTIPLTLYDGVGVTELWVKVDSDAYIKVSGFTSGSTSYSYTVKEGDHKYQFYAKDAAGNQSGTSTEFRVKLDTAKPVIGELTYANQAANLWHWIIGKKDLLIYVPVIDAGSGVTAISYTMTPVDASGNLVSSKAETKTASVNSSQMATISFTQDFKGAIVITCTDAAGNQADSVTVSAGGGVIVENNAPVISFAVDGSAVAESYYDAAPSITVTVTDHENASGQSMVAGGIASVTYQVGTGSTQKVDHNYNASMVTSDSFTIPAEEIPTGETVVKVTARDHAGNVETADVTVRVKGAENTPQAVIDYSAEKLTGLAANGQYTINNVVYTADAQGMISIESGWLNSTLSIIKKGNNSTTLDSASQSLHVPARPNAPTPELASRTDTQITLRQVSGVEYRMPGGEWQTSPVFAGLTAKTKYTFEARYQPTGNSFKSQTGSAEIATCLAAPGADSGKDLVIVDYEKETFTIPDGVEAFQDPACTQPIASGEEHDITDYIGGGIYIRYPADGDFPASAPTEIPVKGRPQVPTIGCKDETYPGAGNGAVTGLTEGTAYEISNDGGNTWTDAVLSGTEIRGLTPGSYQVRVKAGEDHFKSEPSTEVTIGTIPPTAEIPPQAGIDYKDDTLTGLAPGEKYEVSYTTPDGTKYTQERTADADGKIKFDEDWHGQTVEIVKKGNGQDKVDSTPQRLDVPTRPVAPQPGTTDESGRGQNNGAITNLTPGETYQISEDEGKTWKDVIADDEGQIKDLAPGSYEIRIKGKDDTFNSESIKCDIKAYPTKGGGHSDRDKVNVDENIAGGDGDGENAETTGGLGTVLNTGAIIKEVEKNKEVPDTEISMTTGELAAVVLTDAEKQSVKQGANIKIILVVEDAGASVSRQDKAVMNREKGNYQVGQYLDISLFKVLGDSREQISQTNGLIRITIAVPDELKNTSNTKTREFAVIRVHDGEAVILHDLDDVEETVTIETNLFSSYALLYRDVTGDGSEKTKSGRDDEPKTGDYTSLEWYATIEMIAGLAYLLLYFVDGSCGMTEEEKKELVSKIIKWAHRGGKLRRDLALVAIFLLLVYYHSIGKKTDKKISNIDDWMKISVE